MCSPPSGVSSLSGSRYPEHCGLLTWAHHLGDRVRYLIVLNELLRGTGFDAWTDTPEVKAFVAAAKPKVIGYFRRGSVLASNTALSSTRTGTACFQGSNFLPARISLAIFTPL